MPWQSLFFFALGVVFLALGAAAGMAPQLPVEARWPLLIGCGFMTLLGWMSWRYKDPDREFPYYSSPALAGGRVFIGGRDKAIHAIDAATGKGAWKLVTRARVDSSPAVSGSRVFVGSSDGKLYVLDAQTGAKKWEYEVGDALTSSPAIAGGRLVIGAQDGRLYCFG